MNAHIILKPESDSAPAPLLVDNPYRPTPRPADSAPDSTPDAVWERLVSSAPPPRLRSERLGRGRNAHNSIPRLLWLHRRAVEAEMRADFSKADFWWGEFAGQFERLAENSNGEAILRHSLSAGGEVAPNGVWGRLVRERFLSVHIACWNTLNDVGAAVSARAAWHRARVEYFLPSSDLSNETRFDLSLQFEIAAFRADKGPEPVFLRVREFLDKPERSGFAARRVRDWILRVERDHAEARRFEAALSWNELFGRLQMSDPADADRRCRYLREWVELEFSAGETRRAASTARTLHDEFPDRRFPESDSDWIHRRAVRTYLVSGGWGETAWHLLQCCGEGTSGSGTVGHERKLAFYRHALVAANMEANDPRGELKALAIIESALMAVEGVEKSEFLTLKSRMILSTIEGGSCLFEVAEWWNFLNAAAQSPADFLLHGKIVVALSERLRVTIAGLFPFVDESARALMQIPLRRRAIQFAELMCQRVPSCREAFQFAGQAHAGLAVQEMIAGKLSDALVSIERSLTYIPDDPDTRNLSNRMEGMMSNSIRQANALRLSLRRNSYSDSYSSVVSAPSAAGQELLKQADAGTTARDGFRSSEKKTEIRAGAVRSVRFHNWLRAGLEIPESHTEWEFKAEQFEAAIELLVAKNPQSEADVAAGWFEVLKEAPKRTSAISDLGVNASLRLLGNDGSKLEPTNPLESIRGRCRPVDLDWLDEPSRFAAVPESVPEPTEPTSLPIPHAEASRLPIAALRRVPSDTRPFVPFEFWLFSTRDWFAKFSVACVFPLVLSLYLIESSRLEVRARAYADLRSARNDLDSEATTKAIAEFRSVSTIFGDARREGSITRIESQIPDWGRQRQLASSVKSAEIAALAGDFKAAHRAASAFLTAVGSDDDDRRPALEEISSRSERIVRIEDVLAAWEAFRGTIQKPEPLPEEVRTAANAYLALDRADVERFGDVPKRWSEWAADAGPRAVRDAAYADLLTVVREGRPDENALPLMEKFLSIPTPSRGDPRTDQVVLWKRIAEEAPARRRRDAAVEEFVKAISSGDGPKALIAAEEFRRYRLPNGAEPEPRAERLDELAGIVAEWPALAARDAAWQEIQDASRATDDGRLLRAAEKFLSHPPAGKSHDGRTEAAEAAYRRAYPQYMLSEEGSEAEREERTAFWKKFTADSKTGGSR